MPETAQSPYDELIRDFISPQLRSWGFVGTAGRYQRPDPKSWVLLGFQKSAYSDRDEVRFTINLSTIDRDQWAAFRPNRPTARAKPSPSTFYGAWARQCRIGKLTAVGEDLWWAVSPDTHLDQLGLEVLNTIRDVAIPWLTEPPE